MSDQARSAGITGMSVTGAAGLFLGLRLLAVTGYDWDGAFSVASTIQLDDALVILIGTVMAEPVLSGAALILLLPLAWLHYARFGKDRRHRTGSLIWAVTVTVFSGALVWTYRSWWVPLAALAVGGVLAVLHVAGRNDRGKQLVRWVIRQAAAVVLLAVLALAAVVRAPWVSLERIETTDTTMYGYVLEASPSFLKVLQAGSREVIIVDSATVTAREELPPGR